MSQTFFSNFFPEFLKEMCWLSLRVLWKSEGCRMIKTVFKKWRKVGRLTLLDFKNYRKNLVSKLCGGWNKDRQIDPKEQNTGSKVVPHKWSQLTFDQSPELILWGRKLFSASSTKTMMSTWNKTSLTLCFTLYTNITRDGP